MGNNNQYPPLPSMIREGVINRHPELVSGSHEMQLHKSQSDLQRMLKRVQDDMNIYLKRTYSLINLLSYSPRKHCAFTLAEVLITLGIIGVVAAMTMPSLIQNYKYMVLENQLKAAYSDLNQAAKLFQTHNDMSVSEYASTTSAANALNEYSKEFNGVIKKSNLVWDSTDEDGNNIGAMPYELHTVNGSRTVTNCDVSGFIWDTQGRVISFDDIPSYGQNGPKICIDINGVKPPNRQGIDYFVFMFTTDGYVIPLGQEHKNNPECTNVDNNCTIPKTECKYNSSAYGQMACANYALINQHPTETGKDYWHDFVRGR